MDTNPLRYILGLVLAILVLSIIESGVAAIFAG